MVNELRFKYDYPQFTDNNTETQTGSGSCRRCQPQRRLIPKLTGYCHSRCPQTILLLQGLSCGHQIPLTTLPLRPSPAHTRQFCSEAAGLICRKKRKLEKQSSLEYMDQNDDRLKPEGELPATHSPIPSALRSVGCWEKAEVGRKEASCAGPLPPPSARRLQSRETCSQGRTPGILDPLVEVVAGP